MFLIADTSEDNLKLRRSDIAFVALATLVVAAFFPYIMESMLGARLASTLRAIGWQTMLAVRDHRLELEINILTQV